MIDVPKLCFLNEIFYYIITFHFILQILYGSQTVGF